MSKRTLFLKNLLFTIVAPGTVTGLVPYLLMRSWLPQLPLELESARVIGLIPLIAGVLVYLWCVWDFIGARGTPAPIDPPKELVVKGLYRYVRNPMYVGILLIIIGEAILFEAGLLALYALVVFLVTHTFVILYEEPTLQRLFGERYKRYRREVGRWLPRRGSSSAAAG
jgi:protein-S-isoprenylcysteine O-methyltransferase Ste14